MSESKMDRLARALEYRTGDKEVDSYLFDSGDVRDIVERDDGSVLIDLSLASQWTDDYRFVGLVHEFGPVKSIECTGTGCDSCGYGCSYEVILGPKEA